MNRFIRIVWAQPYKDIIIVAAWWGLVAGFGEAILQMYSQPVPMPDLLWAATAVNVALFIAAGCTAVLLGRLFPRASNVLERGVFFFSWLALFDWLAVSGWGTNIKRLLPASMAGAVVVTLGFFLSKGRILYWQRRTLPVLALLCIAFAFGIPGKRRLDERGASKRLATAASNSPNFLVVIVDTLRADHLSAYGYSRPTSPNIDRFASQGVVFDNAIAPSSWTLPSHASMLTGLYPTKHGAETLSSALDSKYPTLAETFKQQGYRTAAFSASTFFFSRRAGLGRGFLHFEDSFQGIPDSVPQTYFGAALQRLLFRWHWKKDVFGRRSAADINQHALRWIDGGKQPFFVVLNYFDVHDPYRPPEPFLHAYSKERNPGGRVSVSFDWFVDLTPAQRQEEMDAYDGAILYMDSQFANLMNELKRRGLEENTLVVLTSDHGESFGEHGFMGHGNALYRELIGVPLIFWGRGKVPSGRRVTQPVSLNGLPATLLSLAAHQAPPKQFPGPSMMELWTDHHHQFANPASELVQMGLNPKFPNFAGPVESLLTPEWHYILSAKSGEELYRCCGQEVEQQNLADTSDGRIVCARMRKELADVRGNAAAPGQHMPYDALIRNAGKKLGATAPTSLLSGPGSASKH
jgi:arylsulfatase A-like enzyme